MTANCAVTGISDVDDVNPDLYYRENGIKCLLYLLPTTKSYKCSARVARSAQRRLCPCCIAGKIWHGTR